MLFAASKIFAILLAPSSFLVSALVVALFAGLLGFIRAARILTWVAALGLVAFGFGPLGRILARPLEDRFTPAAEILVPPAGVIVLGGSIDPLISETRHSISFVGSAGRMTNAAHLALRYPGTRLVFSGGSPDVVDPEHNEASTAKQFFVDLGIQGDRIILESKSRNTFENARFTHELVQPKPGEVWLLVTSAIHMPRAVGSFRKAGFSVVPYPTDYLTRGFSSDFWNARTDFSTALQLADSATHEWIGLMAYWLMGRTDAVLPKSDERSDTSALVRSGLNLVTIQVERPRQIPGGEFSKLYARRRVDVPFVELEQVPVRFVERLEAKATRYGNLAKSRAASRK